MRIKEEKIASIGRIDNYKNCKIIDGSSVALALGFINTHSHSDLEVFKNKDLDYLQQLALMLT